MNALLAVVSCAVLFGLLAVLSLGTLVWLAGEDAADMPPGDHRV